MEAMADLFIDPISAGIPRLFVLAAVIIFFIGMAGVGVRQLDDERRGLKTLATEAGYVLMVVAAMVLAGQLVPLIPAIA